MATEYFSKPLVRVLGWTTTGNVKTLRPNGQGWPSVLWFAGFNATVTVCYPVSFLALDQILIFNQHGINRWSTPPKKGFPSGSDASTQNDQLLRHSEARIAVLSTKVHETDNLWWLAACHGVLHPFSLASLTLLRRAASHATAATSSSAQTGHINALAFAFKCSDWIGSKTKRKVKAWWCVMQTYSEEALGRRTTYYARNHARLMHFDIFWCWKVATWNRDIMYFIDVHRCS